jgi:ABC-type thiamin/hydroxymethylpyrimidine transport system permease subunit
MKKHSRVIGFMAVCLAGFIGQLAASGATTNSVWDLSSISTFKAGKTSAVTTNSVTAVFLSDGTASLFLQGHEYAGTYTNTSKLLTFTIGTNGVAALKSDVAALIQSHVPSAVTITISSVKFSSKIKLSTTGIPVLATDMAKGKGCETFGTKTKCKSISLKTLWTHWTLVSGTAFLAE